MLDLHITGMGSLFLFGTKRCAAVAHLRQYTPMPLAVALLAAISGAACGGKSASATQFGPSAGTNSAGSNAGAVGGKGAAGSAASGGSAASAGSHAAVGGASASHGASNTQHTDPDASAPVDSSTAGAAGTDSGAGKTDAGSTMSASDAGDAGRAVLSVPVSEIAMSLGGAVCDALLACLGPQKLSALFGREPCLTRIAGGLAQDDLASLADSVQKQRVTLNADMLAACYDDTRALGCQVQSQRLPASCQMAIQGQVAIGEACSIGSDCAGDAYCPVGACPRACTARHAAADSCTRDEECVTGLVCNGGSCAAPAATGAACAGRSGAVCAFGASCVGSTDTVAGKCTLNSAVQAGDLGATCTPGGTLCKEGLSCAFASGSAFSCQAAVAADAACELALPSECPNAQYCNAKDVMTAGTCIALPDDGAACVLTDQCAPGNICVLENNKPICRHIGDLGDACTQNGLCRSGSCTSGKCVIETVCP